MLLRYRPSNEHRNENRAIIYGLSKYITLPVFATDEFLPNIIIARAAPKAAEDDIPKVYGEARGLRKIICIITPDTANDIPAIMAAIILGSLMPKKITLAISFSSPDISDLRSEKDILLPPVIKEYKTTTAKNITIAIAILILLSLIILYCFIRSWFIIL